MEYEYTEDMDEISGFGGAYEAACRQMVLAGVKWLKEHPEASPQFHGWKGVAGVIAEDNDDANSLSKAIVEVVPDCSGAMYGSAVSHALYIHANGWDKYAALMRDRKK